MKVFAIQSYEPEEEFMLRFEGGKYFALGQIVLYADRERAELDCKSYNAQFNDETPAEVVELDVL
jgi:hypothetical protein